MILVELEGGVHETVLRARLKLEDRSGRGAVWKRAFNRPAMFPAGAPEFFRAVNR
jgi:hypothetical protein